MNAPSLRAAMLLASLALGVMYILSRYLSPLRDLHALATATAICALWVLYRGTHKALRREAFAAWRTCFGTPMARHPWIRLQIKAAFAWALLDASWIALTVTVSLPWGVPGVMAVLFQGLFLAGFPALENARPDFYDTKEKVQSMDMMEHLMYAQASVVLLCVAWIHSVTH